MRLEFDLEKVGVHLGERHPRVQGLIKQTLGAYIIRNDLRDAERSLDIFWTWHIEKVEPTLTEMGHTGNEGHIGRSIFALTALRITRALDMGANGRARIDIRPAIRADGLEEALDNIIDLRNNELAHYGGFAQHSGIFSDDRAVLVVDNPGDTFIEYVYARWNSERTLAYKMDSVIKSSMNYIESYLDKKKFALLSVLESDADLRGDILDSLPTTAFDNQGFFRLANGGVTLQPNKPVLHIIWE